jgi:ATP-dependent exoDNAse (exonuclease V) beta subunit
MNTLQTRYPHERDKNVIFSEPLHKYTIVTDPTSNYTSVTTWVHSHFTPFNADEICDKMMNGRNWNESNKYWGMTKEQIKQQWSSNTSAADGTRLHYRIECFMNNPQCKTNDDLFRSSLEMETLDNEAPEWNYFLQFIEDYSLLTPYRTEWMIYDEDVKIAGSIDMLYRNEDGSFTIYDWKRTKQISAANPFKKFAVSTSVIPHIPDTNYWHYALQLNIYRRILSRKYGINVRDMMLVRLHPNAESYELICVPELNTEIDAIWNHRISVNTLKEDVTHVNC